MYFEEAKDRLKEQTYIRDKGQFRIVLDIVGDVLVDKCTAAYVKAKLKASGKRKVTLNSYIRTFKIIVHWAYVNDLTDNSRLLDKLVKYPDVSAREKIKENKDVSSIKTISGYTVRTVFSKLTKDQEVYVNVIVVIQILLVKIKVI